MADFGGEDSQGQQVKRERETTRRWSKQGQLYLSGFCLRHETGLSLSPDMGFPKIVDWQPHRPTDLCAAFNLTSQLLCLNGFVLGKPRCSQERATTRESFCSLVPGSTEDKLMLQTCLPPLSLWVDYGQRSWTHSTLLPQALVGDTGLHDDCERVMKLQEGDSTGNSFALRSGRFLRHW